jgi:hypothetical protein
MLITPTLFRPRQVISPFDEDGLPSDWEAIEGLWDHAFK